MIPRLFLAISVMLFAAQSAQAQATGTVQLVANTIHGTVSFSNTDPAAQTILKTFGTGMPMVWATSTAPTGYTTFSLGAQTSPSTSTYALQTESSGLVGQVTYDVRLGERTSLGDYWFTQQSNVVLRPPDQQATGVQVDFAETVTVHRLNFCSVCTVSDVCAQGNAALVASGEITVPGSMTSSVPAGSTGYVYQSNTGANAGLQKGSVKLGFTLLDKNTVNYVLPFDFTAKGDAVVDHCVVLPSGSTDLGRIQTPYIVEGHTLTRLTAYAYGPNNGRVGALTANSNAADSLTWLDLPDLVPGFWSVGTSGLVDHGFAQAAIGTPDEPFRSGGPYSITILAGVSTDAARTLGGVLREPFVMQPAILSGAVHVRDPYVLANPSAMSSLNAFLFGLDKQISDPASPNKGDAFYGPGGGTTVASTCTGSNVTDLISFAGRYDASLGALSSSYSMPIPLVYDQPQHWNNPRLALYFASNRQASGNDWSEIYYNGTSEGTNPTTFRMGTLNLQPLDGNPMLLSAGQAATLDLSFCTSEVTLQYVAPVNSSGTSSKFVNPYVNIAGGYRGIDADGKAANYSATGFAFGTPFVGANLPHNPVGARTSSSAVGFALPQGTFTLSPSVTYIDDNGGSSGANYPPMQVTVGCGQRLSLVSGLAIQLDAHTGCAADGLATVSGSVQSGGAPVSRVWYTINGGAEVNICLGATQCTSSFATQVQLPLANNNVSVYATAEGIAGTAQVTDLYASCGPVCGNGALETGETCDDGNTTDGDGCSGTCAVEPSFACTGSPSTCSLDVVVEIVDTSFAPILDANTNTLSASTVSVYLYDIGGSSPTGPSPQTLHTPRGNRQMEVQARYAGIGLAYYLPSGLQAHQTLRFDALSRTALATVPSVDGTTRIQFVYDLMDVVVRNVDSLGAPLAWDALVGGNVGVYDYPSGAYQFMGHSPQSWRTANGAYYLQVDSRYGGLGVAYWPWYVPQTVERGHTIRVDARTGLSEKFASTTTEILFVYEPLSVRLDAVDSCGTPITDATLSVYNYNIYNYAQGETVYPQGPGSANAFTAANGGSGFDLRAAWGQFWYQDIGFPAINRGQTNRFDGATRTWTTVPTADTGITIVFPGCTNQPPVADAGMDKSGCTGTPVPFVGLGADPDPTDLLSCAWTQLAGPEQSTNLSSKPSASTNGTTETTITCDASFTPAAPGTYTFKLAVTDRAATTGEDSVDVTVHATTPQPIAKASAVASEVFEGAPVELIGSSSYSPDGDKNLSYAWTQLKPDATDPDCVLTGANTASPTCTAPAISAGGSAQFLDLVFQLTVTNSPTDTTCGGPQTSPPATVTVRVANVNHNPIANAGLDQTKNVGAVVMLDGSQSADPDGDALTYAWTQLAGPAATFDATAASPTFTAPAAPPHGQAQLTFSLVVRDPYGGSSAASTVSVTVLSVDAPPACAQAVALPAYLWPPNHKFVPVAIGGLSDPEGDPLTTVVTSVFSDEPTDGLGDGDHSPDAIIASDGTVQVRAERSGCRDGRVYTIAFTASDAYGGSCSGTITTCVAHSADGRCTDQGPLYDATQATPRSNSDDESIRRDGTPSADAHDRKGHDRDGRERTCDRDDEHKGDGHEDGAQSHEDDHRSDHEHGDHSRCSHGATKTASRH